MISIQTLCILLRTVHIFNYADTKSNREFLHVSDLHLDDRSRQIDPEEAIYQIRRGKVVEVGDSAGNCGNCSNGNPEPGGAGARLAPVRFGEC